MKNALTDKATRLWRRIFGKTEQDHRLIGPNGGSGRKGLPQEGDLISIELKEGYGLTGDIYWGRHTIGRVKSQEPSHLFGLVRAVTHNDLEIDFYVTGNRNINDKPKSEEKVLGAYIPKEAIINFQVLNPYNSYYRRV